MADETETIIPESERPSLSPDVDEGFFGEVEFGEPEPETVSEPSSSSSSSGRKETYTDENGEERYVGSNRRVRSDRGGGGGRPKTSRAKGKGKVPDPGAAGATVLYGGIGVVLSTSGLAPAAGFSMQGLADEAGPEISEWAKKRSPRFYQFLVSLSEASGIGKFIAGPVVAEGYLRMEKARPALGPAVVGIHGEQSAAAFDALTAQYDEWKAREHGGSEVPPNMEPEAAPWDPYAGQGEDNGNGG